MQSLAHTLSIAASVAAIAVPAAAIGVVPRFGPGRALALGLTTRLFSRPAVASARAADVAALRRMLAASCRGQYIIVAGPPGVGKSCIITSATEGLSGVVTVRVPAGAPEPSILSDAFTALTRYYLRTLDQSGSARRVLWWHALLFRAPAIVVLQAAARKPTQAFADLDSAARALAGDYGVRVIIDASSCSLPDEALETLREMVLEVEPMPRATLEALPELAPLLAALRVEGVADVVWDALGGVPAAYLALRSAWVAGGACDADAARVAVAFVQDALGKAIRARDEALAANGALALVYSRFAAPSSAHQVPFAMLAALRIVRPAPDRVLRAVQVRASPGAEGSGLRVLVPASAAVGLVLRHELAEPPSLTRLRDLALLDGTRAGSLRC